MESLRDIRQNIKAIRSTQQIMQTMKMISSARIRKATRHGNFPVAFHSGSQQRAYP